MSTTKRPVYTAQLPPTPCTPAMREELVNFARLKGESIAEIQRRAIALFLGGNFSLANDKNIHPKEQYTYSLTEQGKQALNGATENG